MENQNLLEDFYGNVQTKYDVNLIRIVKLSGCNYTVVIHCIVIVFFVYCSITIIVVFCYLMGNTDLQMQLRSAKMLHLQNSLCVCL